MHKKLSCIIRWTRFLHTVDYIMIALVLLSAGVLLYQRIIKKTEWVSVSIRIQPDSLWWPEDPDAWYAFSFLPGEAAYNSFGQQIAKIEDVHTFETKKGKTDTIIDISLKASLDTNRKHYLFNYQPVLVGKPIELPMQHTTLKGIIANIGSPFVYEDKIIEITLLAEFPWKAELLTKGLQAKDYLNRVTAEILDVKVKNAQSYEMYDNRGRRFFVSAVDPERRDITILLKIKSIKHDGIFYSMTGSPLKVGSEFEVQFPNVAIEWGVISKIGDE